MIFLMNIVVREEIYLLDQIAQDCALRVGQ